MLPFILKEYFMTTMLQALTSVQTILSQVDCDDLGGTSATDRVEIIKKIRAIKGVGGTLDYFEESILGASY
jgi:hypothetical protein